jgi:AraC-like DNA-binding protein
MSLKIFIDSLKTLKQICFEMGEVYLCWKDADPTMWDKLPKSLTLHKHPHCLNIKKDLVNIRQCSLFDNLLTSPSGIKAIKRTCPFGYEKWSIPVHYGNKYLGSLNLGPISILNLKKNDPKIITQKELTKIKLLKEMLTPWLEVLARNRMYIFSKTPKNDKIIEAVINHIDSNKNRTIRLDELAKVAHLSSSRLRHRFIEVTGVKISEAIKKSRLSAVATEILTFPDHNIQKIILKWGWEDPAYFNQCFKHAYGLPPAQWRKLKLNSEV